MASLLRPPWAGCPVAKAVPRSPVPAALRKPRREIMIPHSLTHNALGCSYTSHFKWANGSGIGGVIWLINERTDIGRDILWFGLHGQPALPGDTGDGHRDAERYLADGHQGRVGQALRKRFLRYRRGQGSCRSVKHRIGDMSSTGRDHAQTNTWENVGVVRLSRGISTALIHDGIKRASGSEYTSPIGRRIGLLRSAFTL